MDYSEFQGKEFKIISNKESYLFFLEADRIALGRKQLTFGTASYFKELLVKDHVWRFQKLMRKIEYYNNFKKGPLNKLFLYLLLIKYHKRSVKLGYSISINTFGAGLSIAHVGPLIINKGTKIGANCRINAFVNIGTTAGFSNRSPMIGDNVYIGPGAKIFGDIRIGNNIAIGANSVVNTSFQESNILVAGIPAEVKKNLEVDSLLIPATLLLKHGKYNESMAEMPAFELKSYLKENGIDLYK